MDTPKERGAPTNGDESAKTPPLSIPGRALWRAVAIVFVFVFAGSTLMVVWNDADVVWSSWSTEILVVPAFILGIVVAGADYLRQRRR